MAIKLNTTNGSITLDAEDGSGNVNVTLPRAGIVGAAVLEDADGTEVSLSDDNEIKFIGDGITINWTDTSTGSDADPYDMTFTVDAAQSNITSVGTLTALTVDNVVIDGAVIGHTGDTDLITLASGVVTVAGEVSATTLDIGGTNITSTAAELNLMDGGTSAGTTAVAGTDGLITNDGGTMQQTTVDTFDTYFAGTTKTLTNKTLTSPTLNSPVLVTPALGTPASGVATNLTGTAASLTAGNVTTNANLTGHITSTGNAAVLGSFTSAQLATAVTDETGSGAAVFATSPTLVTPALGTPTSGNLSGCTVDGTNAPGYKNIPQNSQSAAYTLVLTDAGKHIAHPSSDAVARTYTIPAHSSVAYPVGTALTFTNMTSQVVTIAITSDTMYLAKAGTTGSRSLAQYGMATALKIENTKWLISGNGLS